MEFIAYRLTMQTFSLQGYESIVLFPLAICGQQFHTLKQFSIQHIRSCSLPRIYFSPNLTCTFSTSFLLQTPQETLKLSNNLNCRSTWRVRVCIGRRVKMTFRVCRVTSLYSVSQKKTPRYLCGKNPLFFIIYCCSNIFFRVPRLLVNLFLFLKLYIWLY